MNRRPERPSRDDDASPRGMHDGDDYEMARQRTGGREEHHGNFENAYRPSWNWDDRPPRRDGFRADGLRAPTDEERWSRPDAYRTDGYRTNGYGGGQYGDNDGTRGRQESPPRVVHADRVHEHHHGFLERVKELIGKGPRNYRRTDERVLDEVCEKLSQGYLDASGVDVVVKDGVVTLEGTVASKRDVRLAEDLIENVHGVREVENRLRANRRPDDATASTLPDTVRGGSSRRGSS
jgi:hypothetical protein